MDFVAIDVRKSRNQNHEEREQRLNGGNSRNFSSVFSENALTTLP